ncbi:hypothetical protein Ddc_12489 [Ditylenchus destructor]|nr:hypothetical protein Ddc_12489 [Ditylenchus destructor]
MMLLGLFGLLFVAHVTEAGTWLSFNQKTGGMNQPILHYVPYSQSDIQNPPPAIEPAALPTPPYTFGDTNLLHLLELCNEGSVRAIEIRFAVKTDLFLCQTLRIILPIYIWSYLRIKNEDFPEPKNV